VDYLTCVNRFSRRPQLFEKRQKVVKLVARHADNYKTNFQFGQVLLVLKIAVDRYKYVELFLSQRKQRAVLTTTPSDFCDGLDIVTGERGLYTDVYTLI